MVITFTAMPTEWAEALWQGGPDAYGNTPDQRVSDGIGVPCRHCLRIVPAGEQYLIVACRPFSSLQPYAETGPVFLCASPCERAPDGPSIPEILKSDDYIVRGYDSEDRIVYGTGSVTPTSQIVQASKQIFSDGRISYVHIRSSHNNCYQCRVERR